MRLLFLLFTFSILVSIAAPSLSQDEKLISRIHDGEAKTSIGYPTVAAALEALHSRSDVTFSQQEGWTIAYDPKTDTLWSFTPTSHPAYPAVVKRTLTKNNSAVYVEMSALCKSEQSACDKLWADFIELNKQMSESFQLK